MILTAETEGFGETAAPVSLRQPQIYLDSPGREAASTVSRRRLATWAMAWPWNVFNVLVQDNPGTGIQSRVTKMVQRH